MTHARLGFVADGSVGNVLSLENNLARAWLFKPGERLHKLALPVAVDACDADNLPAAHIERHILHRIVVVCLARHGHVLNFQDGFPRHCLLLLHGKADISSNHHAGEFLLCRIFDVHGSDVLSLAQNRAPVGNLHNLV